MAVSGVRARRFIQPGGASAIFQRQRGMVAPAPIRSGLPGEDDKSRSGKATGRDYGNFFSKKRNVSAIKGAVNALKGLLVGTFIAAKSLGATLKNVVGQINGFVKDKGAGLLGKLGTVGIIAAVVVGVAAIFGPQIKKAFDFLKTKAEDIFQDVKKRLADYDQRLEKLYNTIRKFVNVTIRGVVENINGALAAVNGVIKAIKPVAAGLASLPNVGFLGPIKGLGKALSGLPTLPDELIPLNKLPKLPEYRDVLGDKGINFLSGYDSLGDLGGSMMSGLGGMLTGGIDSITGVMGDFLNNFFADMGLTDKANDVLGFFGMDASFGARRDIGSGQGVSSLVPDGMFDGLGSMFGLGGNQQQSGTGGTGGGDGTMASNTFDVIGSGEGDYNSVNRGNAGDTPGGAKSIFGKNITDMTVDEVYAAQRAGKVFAVGKYQIIDITMPGFLEYLKRQNVNTSTTKFNPATQEKFKLYVINEKRPEIGRYLRGESDDLIGAAQGAAREFASVGVSKPEQVPGFAPADVGDTLYGGRGNNAASISPQKIQEALRRDRQLMTQPAPPAPAAPAPKAQSARDAFIPPPKSKASSMIMPGSMNIASAPRRPRPDVAPENVSGSDGNPHYTHHSSTYFDPSTLSSLVAVG